MAQRLDRRAAFEDFEDEILPKMRKMLREGRTAEEITAFAQAYAAARVVTIALSDADSGKALAAAKDVLDRTQGKAKERTETTHKFEKLKDEELDSLILSRLKEEGSDEDEDREPLSS